MTICMLLLKYNKHFFLSRNQFSVCIYYTCFTQRIGCEKGISVYYILLMTYSNRMHSPTIKYVIILSSSVILKDISFTVGALKMTPRTETCRAIQINDLIILRSKLVSFYPQKLALTSPTSGGRSIGIVRLWTKATE
jgi:hypothetical protein